MINILLKWIKWKIACYNITSYLDNDLLDKPLYEGWYLEIKNEKYKLIDKLHIGHVLGQNDKSIAWTKKKKKEMKLKLKAIIYEKNMDI
jgi:hypothetical protein